MAHLKFQAGLTAVAYKQARAQIKARTILEHTAIADIAEEVRRALKYADTAAITVLLTQGIRLDMGDTTAHTGAADCTHPCR